MEQDSAADLLGEEDGPGEGEDGANSRIESEKEKSEDEGAFAGVFLKKYQRFTLFGSVFSDRTYIPVFVYILCNLVSFFE